MDFKLEKNKKECIILKLSLKETKTIINALKYYRKPSETLDEECRASVLYEDILQIYCCFDVK